MREEACGAALIPLHPSCRLTARQTAPLEHLVAAGEQSDLAPARLVPPVLLFCEQYFLQDGRLSTMKASQTRGYARSLRLHREAVETDARHSSTYQGYHHKTA